jgi:hypothetical protein
LVAHESAEREGLGNEIAEGVARVSPGRVGFIDVGLSPSDFVQVADEFAAARVDEEAGVSCGVSEAAVDAIYTITDSWIDRI